MENQRDGKTPETAFLALDSSGEFTPSIRDFVERMFGGKDGDHFILSETTMEAKDHGGKKYKVLYIEDHKNQKHTVYFELG